MYGRARRASVLALAGAMVGCLTKPNPYHGRGDSETTSTGSGPETGAIGSTSDGVGSTLVTAGTTTSDETTSAVPGSSSGAVTTGAGSSGCPDQEAQYRCPFPLEFVTEFGWAGCHVDGLELPSSDFIDPYCWYIDDGYFGFSWDLATEDAVYLCPPDSVYAPSSMSGFCLWDLDPVPPGTEPRCDDIQTTAGLGYRWPCP